MNARITAQVMSHDPPKLDHNSSVGAKPSMGSTPVKQGTWTDQTKHPCFANSPGRTPPPRPTHARASASSKFRRRCHRRAAQQGCVPRGSRHTGLMIVVAALTGLLLHPSCSRLQRDLLYAVDTAWRRFSAVTDTQVSHVTAWIPTEANTQVSRFASSWPPLSQHSSLDPTVALHAMIILVLGIMVLVLIGIPGASRARSHERPAHHHD